MKVQEILLQLASAEFAQAGVTNSTGLVESTRYLQVLNLINAGIIELYKRFMLGKKELIVMVSECREIYPLIPENNVRNTGMGIEGFILPNVYNSCDWGSNTEDFKGDIKEIIVIRSMEGEILRQDTIGGIPHKKYMSYMGTRGYPYHRTYYDASLGLRPYDKLTDAEMHVSLQDYRTLLIKNPRDVNLLITYEVSFLPLEFENILEIPNLEINLQREYLEPLLFYIASRFFNPLGAAQVGSSQFHEGNNYAQRFEESCQRLQGYGLEVDHYIDDNWYPNKGFI